MFNFQRNVNIVLEQVFSKAEDAAKMSEARISFHETALTKNSKENYPTREENSPASHARALHQRALAKSYSDNAYILFKMQNYTKALQAEKHSIDITRKLFGEEHSRTADSYHSLGVTQHAQGDFASAIQSKQRALHIRQKLFGEEHSSTADSYDSLGVTQHADLICYGYNNIVNIVTYFIFIFNIYFICFSKKLACLSYIKFEDK